MKITFLGGVENVSGSSFILESGEEKILIDCGMEQGESYCENKNFTPLPYDAKEIKAVLITHAHIDHTGLLPKLYKEGFHNKIFSTAPTRDFTELLLLDSEDILRKEAEKRREKPIYKTKDINALMDLWEKVEYKKVFQLGKFSVEFFNAGHILGSASIKVIAEGKSVVFSGDLGNLHNSIMPVADEIEEADYALIESTYGNRIHEDAEKRRDLLEDFIEEVINGGGTLLIPAFAMERTQELLVELNELVSNGRIPRVPIYMDSPLAIKLTTIYKKYQGFFRIDVGKEIRTGDEIFNFPGLETTLSSEESREIEKKKGSKIIIAGSGMSQGGRILRHELNYLSDKKNGILFVSYQGKETLGRKIQEGAEKVEIYGKEVEVNCKRQSISGYSAHADQEELLAWLKPMTRTLRKIFITHGDEENSAALKVKIMDEFAIEAEIPKEKEEDVL